MKNVIYFIIICLLLIGFTGTVVAQTENTVVWQYADYRPPTGAGYTLVSCQVSIDG